MIGAVGLSAVVTGASRGIGLAVAQALHRQGFSLGFLCRSRPAVPGEFVACDFSDPAAVAVAARDLALRLGPVALLVNNAGTFLEKPVPDIRLEDWTRVLNVNLTSTFVVTRELLSGMIERKRGRIINIASTASTQGYLHQSAYVASKHGMLGFARSLAMELKPHNIHVHNLCPGGVDTDLIRGTYLEQRLKGQTMIRPEGIAEMVLFLVRQPENIDLSEMVVRRFQP